MTRKESTPSTLYPFFVVSRRDDPMGERAREKARQFEEIAKAGGFAPLNSKHAPPRGRLPLVGLRGLLIDYVSCDHKYFKGFSFCSVDLVDYTEKGAKVVLHSPALPADPWPVAYRFRTRSIWVEGTKKEGE